MKSLTLTVVLAALTYLGQEVPEDITAEEARTRLEDELAKVNLSSEQFLTDEALFAMGYSRGMQGAGYSEELQVPKGEDGTADRTLATALEDGLCFGLEARDVANPPPPSLVHAAFKSGALKMGQFGAWAQGLDLSTTKRLAAALTVGAGKGQVVIPAGTPVDVLAEVEKDGVNHVVVAYDGVALIVPNPESDPRIVAGNVTVARASKAKGGAKSPRKKKEGDAAAKEPKAKADRGPTLQSVIIDVIEGKDGGPGVLCTNGQFAARVVARARELGIGDKANMLVQKADKHVPYYIGCYRPSAKTGEVGRLGVEAPTAGQIAKIDGRKYYLQGEGSHEERLARIPSELRAKFDDATPIATKPAAKKPKKSAEGGDGSSGDGEAASSDPTAEQLAEAALSGADSSAPQDPAAADGESAAQAGDKPKSKKKGKAAEAQA